MALAKRARTYGGKSAAERDAERRRRLLEAGLAIFGESGFGSSTIEGICRRAGVTARNFYDHFDSREALLGALYEEITTEQMDAVRGALEREVVDVESHVRGAMEAAIAMVEADERRARIAYIEIVGVSPELERRRFEIMAAYHDLLDAYFARLAERGLIPPRTRLTAIGVLGAAISLVEQWLLDEDRPPLADVLDEAVRIIVAAIVRA